MTNLKKIYPYIIINPLPNTTIKSFLTKVSDDWIRDLGFNPCLHQKPIGILIWWKKVSSKADAIGWNSLKKITSYHRHPCCDGYFTNISAYEVWGVRVKVQVSKRKFHTHTHTHTHIYIYIYTHLCGVWYGRIHITPDIQIARHLDS